MPTLHFLNVIVIGIGDFLETIEGMADGLSRRSIDSRSINKIDELMDW